MYKARQFVLFLLIFVVAVGFVHPLSGGSAFAQSDEVGVYAYDSEPYVYWDPADTFSNEIVVLQNVYETLLRYHPQKDEFEPVLAKSYSSSEDGLTWTFQLREGVKFHTGGEMTAEAVKFSINRTMERGKGASFIWNPVDKIEVVDRYTVKFHLKYPAPVNLIASGSYAAYIYDPDHSEHSWYAEGRDAGTGPYTIASHQGKEQVVIEKFEDYWGGWEGKHFEKVLFKKVSEPSTRRMMIEKGQADFTNRLPPTAIEALKGKQKVDIVETPSFQNLLALYNTAEDGPMSNRLVRKALSYALPYQNIVEDILEGYGRQSRGVVPYGLWGHSDKVRQYSYSPETAETLLKEAGYWEDGLELQLTYVSGNEYERKIAQLWKSELADLNVDLEVRGMPWSSQVSLGQSPDPNKRQDIFLFYWWPDYPHPHSFLSAMFESRDDIQFNFTYYDSPLFDNLINRANSLSGINRDAAEKVYGAAQNILLEDAAGAPIYDMSYVRALNSSLKGYEDNPAYSHVVFWYDCYRE